MNTAARAAAYLAQTGAQTMTPRQARRYRRKAFRGESILTTTALRDAAAVDGPPTKAPRGGGPASPAVEPRSGRGRNPQDQQEAAT